MAQIHLSAIEASLATIKPIIDALLASAEACHGAVCSQRDAIMDILEQAGNMMYVQKIPPEHVLCHDMNRSGQGLDPARCINLMETIAHVGFSNALTAAIAFEIPPSGARRKKIEQFNMRMAAASGNILAPVSPDACKVASVSGSHLSGGMRAIHFGMPCETESCISADGKLSAMKVGTTDKASKEALELERRATS